jgi:hypothetical protein
LDEVSSEETKILLALCVITKCPENSLIQYVSLLRLENLCESTTHVSKSREKKQDFIDFKEILKYEGSKTEISLFSP